MTNSLKQRELTRKEKTAIRRLHKLADYWPESLTLFSWDGNLHIYITDEIGEAMDSGNAAFEDAIIDTVDGIPNDGGAGP